jgi:glycosyltransferase involved in cell wall biosynthesis
MRIVHIITRMIVGGAQENTLYNCLDLIETYGDEVVLLTGPTDGPEGRLLEQGRAGGLQVITIPSLRRALHPLRDLQAYRSLREAIRRLQPEVVHTHSAKAGILGRAAAWKEKVPAVVHTVHGAPFYPYQAWPIRRFYQACEAWAAARCHHLIAVAEAMADLMVEAGVCPRGKISTIYSGMEVEPFLQADEHRLAMRARLGLEDKHIVVGKVARLFELKGHEYLIEAAARTVAIQPNLRFLLVGDGGLRPRLEEQVRRLGLERFFVFAGLVPPAEIPAYLSAMDMLVHCSLREGLARALPQALLAGKPVISFDIDGAREVCLDQRTGYLLPPKSITGLERAMVELANDPARRCEWGRAGQQLFAERFRHQNMTAQIRQLYQGLLSPGSV